MTSQQKEKKFSPAETIAVKNFINKAITAFNQQKPFPPATKAADSVIEWRLFLNHFFFIERGRETKAGASAGYIAVLQRTKDADTELWRAEALGDGRWSFLSAPDEIRGQKVLSSIEGTDEAAIAIMISYLFHNNYIVADVDDDDVDDSDDLDASELEIIG